MSIIVNCHWQGSTLCIVLHKSSLNTDLHCSSLAMNMRSWQAHPKRLVRFCWYINMLWIFEFRNLAYLALGRLGSVLSHIIGLTLGRRFFLCIVESRHKKNWSHKTQTGWGHPYLANLAVQFLQNHLKSLNSKPKNMFTHYLWYHSRLGTWLLAILSICLRDVRESTVT